MERRIMNDDMFQKVMDVLIDYLPEGWKKTVFYAGYAEGSYTMKFFYFDQTDVFVDCFNKYDDDILDDLFDSIDSIILQERKLLTEKHKWNSMTMVVTNDGKMNCDYDYDDIFDTIGDNYSEWKKKYLE